MLLRGGFKSGEFFALRRFLSPRLLQELGQPPVKALAQRDLGTLSARARFLLLLVVVLGLVLVLEDIGVRRLDAPFFINVAVSRRFANEFKELLLILDLLLAGGGRAVGARELAERLRHDEDQTAVGTRN